MLNLLNTKICFPFQRELYTLSIPVFTIGNYWLPACLTVELFAFGGRDNREVRLADARTQRILNRNRTYGKSLNCLFGGNILLMLASLF